MDPHYEQAIPLAGDTMESLIRIAQSPDWPGYFGSPRLAAPARTENGWQGAAQQAINLALKILDGVDEKSIVRFGDEMSNSQADVCLDKAARNHEAKIKRRQQLWPKSRGLA